MSRCVLSAFWICLIAVVIVTGNADVRPHLKKTVRIVNGVDRTIEELPYIVQIRDPHQGTVCGGTLISPQHVLTAAHCFDGPPNWYKTATVVAGASKRSEAGVQRKAASVSIHPEYENLYEAKGTILEKKVGSHADVAIIKLDMPFEETKQIKVMKNFCPGPLSATDYLEVSGWGHTKQIDPLSTEDIDWALAEQLQSVRLPIISNEDCTNKMSSAGVKLTDTNVCAFERQHDSCISDSGGPGVHRGQLCAVVSYGIGCAYGQYPGVYTSIHTVRDFIDKQIEA